MTRVAAYDLGSNSFHLLVADVSEDGRISRVVRRKVMLRLGSTVAEQGAIGHRIHEVIETLLEFQELVAAAGAHRSVACATAAFRDAADQGEVLRSIAEATGLQVAVISGEVEARLVFRAVQASLNLPRRALCLDLGGGSLELMVGDAQQLEWVASVPLGVARLTANHVRKDPPRTADLARLRDAIAQQIDPLLPDIQRLQPRMLVGTSGTLKNLAAAALQRGRGAAPAPLHEATVGRPELENLHDLLVTLPNDQRADLPGIEPRRAPLVIAGSVVLNMVMQATAQDTLTISEWALREGMLLAGAGADTGGR